MRRIGLPGPARVLFSVAIALLIPTVTLVGACKKKAPAPPEGFPEAFPLPEASDRVEVDTSGLSDDQAWVFEYPGSSPYELADDLRDGLAAAGWEVTWEDVSEGRHLVQVEHEGVRIDAAVLAGDPTTLTVRVTTPDEDEASEVEQAPALPTPAEVEPGPSTPPRPLEPTLTGAPADYPEGFPFLAGGTRDPGYPPESAGYPEFLFVYTGLTVEQASQRLRTEAETMGWTCTDYDPSSVACQQGNRLVSLNLDRLPPGFPIPGDIAVFVAELPGSP